MQIVACGSSYHAALVARHWIESLSGLPCLVEIASEYRYRDAAVIPGSLTGAIPVLMGYVAAGGSYYDASAVFVAFFVFMWQIPHFWLLTLIYGRDYETANYPTLFRVFSEPQIRRWTMVWIIAACMVSLTIRHFGIVSHFSSSVIIIVINAVLIVLSYLFLLRKPKISKYKIIFHLINLFMVFGLLVISFEKMGWF